MDWAVHVEAQRRDDGRIAGVRLRLEAPGATLLDHTFTPASELSLLHVCDGGDGAVDVDGWETLLPEHLLWQGGSLRKGCRLRPRPVGAGIEREPLLVYGDATWVLPVAFEHDVDRALHGVLARACEMAQQHRRRTTLRAPR